MQISFTIKELYYGPSRILLAALTVLKQFKILPEKQLLHKMQIIHLAEQRSCDSPLSNLYKYNKLSVESFTVRCWTCIFRYKALYALDNTFL